MRNYFATGCLGVTPRGGCVVTALCMIMVSTMHIIFESGHLRDHISRINVTCTPLKSPCHSSNADAQKNMRNYSYTTFFMLGLSIIVCFILLLSVYKNYYKGVLVYIGFNVLYELFRVILLAVSYSEMKKIQLPFGDLQWVGIGFRIPLQAFFMVYVVTYVLELTESKGRPLMRRRKVTKKQRRAKSPRTPPALKFAVKEDA